MDGERRNKILELKEKGFSYTEICRELNCDKSQLLIIAEKINGKKRKNQSQKKKIQKQNMNRLFVI